MIKPLSKTIKLVAEPSFLFSASLPRSVEVLVGLLTGIHLTRPPDSSYHSQWATLNFDDTVDAYTNLRSVSFPEARTDWGEVKQISVAFKHERDAKMFNLPSEVYINVATNVFVEAHSTLTIASGNLKLNVNDKDLKTESATVPTIPNLNYRPPVPFPQR